MDTVSAVIRVYYAPQTFPCGQQSTCCGPMGQSKEELERYKVSLEKEFPGAHVRFIDASQQLDPKLDAAALNLIFAFGDSACPLFAVGEEIVSMGPPELSELAGIIRGKMAGAGK